MKKTKSTSEQRKSLQKRQLDLYLALLIPAMILIFVILFLVIPDKEYSNRENRNLQTFPAVSVDRLLEGNAQTDTESYIQDQFPLRDLWTGLGVSVSKFLGKKENNQVYRASGSRLISEDKEPDSGLMEKQLDAINRFTASISGIKYFMLIVPTAGEIYQDELPVGAPMYDMSQYRKQLEDAISENITWLDVFTTLSTHADEGVFYRTDSNWNSLGAYYAYREVASKLGYDIGVDGFESVTVTESFRGNLACSSHFSVTPDTINVYFPTDSSFIQVTEYVQDQRKSVSPYDSEALSGSYKYDVFYGGDHPLLRINSTSSSKDRLLVIKDSSANCFIPFLSSAYREVMVVDPQYYYGNLEELIQNENITSVLFLYGAAGLSVDTALAPLLDASGTQEDGQELITNGSTINSQ